MSKDLPVEESGAENQMRINRFLAEAGVCSRRDADELIFSGQVTINGHKVDSPGVYLDSQNDSVKVAGKRVRLQPMVYVLLNKPEGVVSTVSDPEHRTTVVDLLRGVKARVFPVGRLDYNTSGLLLMTNDGELALRLTHPRFGFPKTYQAKVDGIPSEGALRKLASGVPIPAWSGRYEKTMPAKVRLLKKFRNGAMLELTLQEGRQHQVRKMCAAVGHPVTALSRTKFGPLTTLGVGPGQWRLLTHDEVKRLQSFRPAPRAAAKPTPEPAWKKNRPARQPHRR